MTKIEYELSNGSLINIEVSETVAAAIIEIRNEEKRERWREHKRKTRSLNALLEKGYNPPDKSLSVIESAEISEEKQHLHNALKSLSASQQHLIYLIYFERLSIAEIARRENVDRRSIYYRLQTVHKKIKTLLKTTFPFPIYEGTFDKK